MKTFREHITESTKIETASADNASDRLYIKSVEGIAIELGIPDDADFNPYIKIQGREIEIESKDIEAIAKFIKKFS